MNKSAFISLSKVFNLYIIFIELINQSASISLSEVSKLYINLKAPINKSQRWAKGKERQTRARDTGVPVSLSLN